MVGHLFGYEAALAIDAQARPLREARAVHRRRCSLEQVDGDDAARPPAARCSSRSPSAGSSTACAAAPTTATSRPAPRCGIASLLRYASGLAAPRRVPGRLRHGRARPRVLIEDLTAALEQRHRGADPAGRRHQAPGQDRHGGHLPLRRGAARRCRWWRRCSHAGARTRPAQLPRAAHARRLDPAVAEATGYTRYRIEGRRRRRRGLHRGGRPRRDLASTCRRAPSRTRCCAAPSAGWPSSAR